MKFKKALFNNCSVIISQLIFTLWRISSTSSIFSSWRISSAGSIFSSGSVVFWFDVSRLTFFFQSFGITNLHYLREIKIDIKTVFNSQKLISKIVYLSSAGSIFTSWRIASAGSIFSSRSLSSGFDIT
jgi:hypothetical protein